MKWLTVCGVTVCGLSMRGATASNWVEFLNETSERVAASNLLVVNDVEEKDYAWGDVDNDGDVDLIIVRKQPGGWDGKKANVLLLNEGGVLTDRTSEFASASDIPGDAGFLTPTNDRDVALADLDLDGWLDIVTAVAVSDSAPKHIGYPRVYRNLGEDPGTGDWLGFRHEDSRIPLMLSDSGQPGFNPRFTAVAVGDVTDDGYPDLYFSDHDNGVTSPFMPSGADYNDRLLINAGFVDPGVFADETEARLGAVIALSAYGTSCAIVDMNNDGNLDIVKDSALQLPWHVAVAYDLGGSGFFGAFDVVNEDAPYFISVGDLNNDNRNDIVVSDDGIDHYLINNGNGGDGLANFTKFNFPSSTDGFGSNSVIADLDKDGWNDVIIADVDVDFTGCEGIADILRNNACGPNVTFTADNGIGITDSMLQGVHDVAVFDINGDTWLDLVIGRCESTEVWIQQPDSSDTDCLRQSGDQSGDLLGSHVAVDGDLALASAAGANAGAGAVYAYEWDGTCWLRTQTLTADSVVGDGFGGGLAISGDVAIIGAPFDDDGGSDSGSVYIFRRQGPSWVEETKFTASDIASNDRFGRAVDISGAVAVVGSWFDDDGGGISGSAYVYRFDGAEWVEEDKLHASDPQAGDRFGDSVTIDGDVIAVGAYLEDQGGSDTGAVYVYRYDGANWIFEQKLTALDAESGDHFGRPVAISGDVLFVGAPLEDTRALDAGAVYVQEWDGAWWQQRQKLTASDGALGDAFGLTLALDGGLAIIGALWNNDLDVDSGSAYGFALDGCWVESVKLTALSRCPDDQFGAAVAISGERAVVGAWQADVLAVDSGAIYAAEIDPVTVPSSVMWAGTLLSSTGVIDPFEALQAPNGQGSSFWPGVPVPEATYSGFGAGDVTAIDACALANLIGVSATTVYRAEFITFEHNGLPTGTGYESGVWTFDDGTTQLVVDYDYIGPLPAEVLAAGETSTGDYAAFFGFEDPFGSGDIPYLLIDLDGLDLVAPALTVTLAAEGGGFTSPDPDAMGLLFGNSATQPCVAASDCADLDTNGTRDDNCVWWECAVDTCLDTPLTQFADMGGAFGDCRPDGFANIHDRNQSLSCFAGTNPCDPINIDAGGAFGACPPDGFCNIHDANHALSAFAGTTTCSCPSGPQPQMEPTVVGEATLQMQASQREARPGDKIKVRVVVTSSNAALRSYQLDLEGSGGYAGTLELVGIEIEPRKDWVFAHQVGVFDAINTTTGQMLAGVEQDISVKTADRGYLVTYTYAVSTDAKGAFLVGLDGGPDGQTFLIAPENGEIAITGTTPAVITVGDSPLRR